MRYEYAIEAANADEEAVRSAYNIARVTVAANTAQACEYNLFFQLILYGHYALVFPRLKARPAMSVSPCYSMTAWSKASAKFF